MQVLTMYKITRTCFSSRLFRLSIHWPGSKTWRSCRLEMNKYYAVSEINKPIILKLNFKIVISGYSLYSWPMLYTVLHFFNLCFHMKSILPSIPQYVLYPFHLTYGRSKNNTCCRAIWNVHICSNKNKDMHVLEHYHHRHSAAVHIFIHRRIGI